MNYYSYNTVIGELFIKEDNGKIVALGCAADVSDSLKKETDLIKYAYTEICEYFVGKRINFDIPIKFNGTEFQKKVWLELQKIPYAKTVTYKEIAENLGNNKACRAVGQACNKNPLLILIPCHRVTGANKSLTGFAIGVDIKEKLINIEAERCMKN